MRFLQQGDSSALLGWDFDSLPAVWVLDPPSALADTNLSAFIWSVADLLRGDYKQSDYGKVILPFTVLRRLDCVLEPTKAAVLEEKALREGQGLDPEPFLLRKAGHNFCNTSPLDMKRLMGDGDNIAENLRSRRSGSSASSGGGGSSSGRYRCKEIGSWSKAQDLLRQGHRYLDGDGDGEACESLK